MLNISRFPRRARSFVLLTICLLALSALPGRPASAAVISKQLDDSLPDFTRGTFQRSSLSSYKGAAPDTKGAVQLIPVSVINDWQRSGFTLEKKLSDLGAATIGATIFVLGGVASDGTLDPTPTAEVWSVRIDPTTGAPTTNKWNSETPLPSVQHGDPFPTAVAARSSIAVTSVETGPDSGYIYVIGGRYKPIGSSQALSSYAVSIATVAAGHITRWTSSNSTNLAGLRIPTDAHVPPWGLNGLQSASALTFKNASGTYVYLIGGLERFLNGGTAQEVGSKQVYYAKVRSSDGMLVKPSNGAVGWDTLAPLPIPTQADVSTIEPALSGLWDATAVADHFAFGDATKDVLYVMGGQYQSQIGNGSTPDLFSSSVYRAFIGANGALTWTSAGPNLWEGTLPTARLGMGGEEVNGKLYLTGGRAINGGVPGPPEGAVLASFVEDNFKLAQIGDQGSNFIYKGDALRNPPAQRTHHGMVKVQIPVTDQEAVAPAYIYVVAGQGTSDDQSAKGSDTLIYAKVGGQEDTLSIGFASSGWYYSTVHETNRSFSGEQVQEIDWTTLMTDTALMDIELQYRISTDNECANPIALNSALWVNIDGSPDAKRSRNGANSFLLGTPPPTHCFQYRAKLVNGSGGVKLSTPSLMNVSIKVIIPGSPDLQVQTLKDTRNVAGQFTGLNVELLNHYNDTTPGHLYPTQPADIEKGGSFFVDLFVFGPGQTPVEPVPPWTTNPAGDKACASIAKSQMLVDAKILIPRWYKISDLSCATTPIDILTLFPQPGNYVVYAVVDSYDCSTTDTAKGCVDESSPGAEANNVKKLQFTITQGGIGYPDVLLPYIGK